MGWQHTKHIRQTFSVILTLLVMGVSVGAFSMLAHGAKFLSVQSGSMVPTFHKGDLVIDTPVPAQQLAVGDVVTYTNPNLLKGQPITHRLVQTGTFANGNHFITRGDANPVADPPITARNIIGKASHRVPYLGYGFDFVRRPLGLALLIYIPALIIVMFEIKRLVTYYKTQEPYVAAGVDPLNMNIDGRSSRSSRADTLTAASGTYAAAKASALLVIITIAVAVPTVHAALMSSVRLTPNTISTFIPANHLLVYKVNFISASSTGGGTTSTTTSNTTNVTVINNNHQTATSGNATSSGSGNATSSGSGNATSGNASNSSNTTININIGGSNPTTPAGNQTVTLYNPTAQPINLAGYKLADNGTAQTITSGTISAKGFFAYTWPVADGLSRSGDRLLLRTNASAGVDSLSWGSDTSQLNPAITSSSAPTTLTRKAPALDTNTAADWLAAP